MHSFTPGSALLGGALIGMAVSVALLLNGRLAGISGIFAGLLRSEPGSRDEWAGFRFFFVLGLLAGGAGLLYVLPSAFEVPATTPMNLLRFGAAGLLVGFGSRLGGGCTSGHGVCGLSLRSSRSLAATLIFMGTAFAVVLTSQHLLRGTL